MYQDSTRSAAAGPRGPGVMSLRAGPRGAYRLRGEAVTVGRRPSREAG
ncbi:hypothetical protein [Dactylosporangium sp. NPDC048998]